jgi:hypothetical protein
MGFDPLNYPDTKAIFDDPIARTFYLAWRQGHIVNQHFTSEVMQVAMMIRERKPHSVEDLKACFGNLKLHVGSNFTVNDIANWCPLALPYFTGEATMNYEVMS